VLCEENTCFASRIGGSKMRQRTGRHAPVGPRILSGPRWVSGSIARKFYVSFRIVSRQLHVDFRQDLGWRPPDVK
jgi:hypothetical protein